MYKNGFVKNLLASFCKNNLEKKEKKQSHPLNKVLDKNGNTKIISSYYLKKGDIVILEVDDIIPSDGEVIEGLALVDESAITGESVPVMKEAGGDSSSVICGTRLVSNYLKIKLTKSPTESCQSRIFSSTELDTM